jgi:hypothetical protein
VGLLLGLVLICSGLACAPQFVGPTAAGYAFALTLILDSRVVELRMVYTHVSRERAVYLHTADTYHGLTHRPSQE